MRRFLGLLFLLGLVPAVAEAQGVSLSPSPIQNFLDNNGIPCIGCQIFTYAAGTTTPLASYTDSTGNTPQTNPIILNARGEPQSGGSSVGIWLGNATYKFVLAPATDTNPPTNPTWTVDNIPGSGLAGQSALACPWPTSFGSTPINCLSVNVNNYPLAQELQAGVVQGVVGKVVVPNGYTQQPQPNTAISGYIENDNSVAGNSGVAVYGIANTNVDGASPYGGNFTVQNYRGPYTTNGHDFGVAIGMEIDTSIGEKAGGITPTGTMFGIYTAGFSNVKPAGGAIAQYLLPFGTGIPWDRGWQSVDGATVTSLSIGASGSGNNVGGQPIQFTSRTSGGVTNFSSINVDTAGGFNLAINSVPALNVEPQSASFNAPLVVGSNSQSAGGGIFLAHQGTNANLQVEGAQDLADGVTIVSQVDALNANKGLEFIATNIELKPSAALTIPTLPASAGSGGIYVCIDNTGKLYQKSSCP